MKFNLLALFACLMMVQTAFSQNETFNPEDPNLAMHKTDGAGVAAIGCGDPNQRCDSHIVRTRLSDPTRADRNIPRSSGGPSQEAQEGSR